MLSYPEIKLPEATRPFFRQLHARSWTLAATHLSAAKWSLFPVLEYHNPAEPDLGRRFISMVIEPHWCGNSPQQNAGIRVLCASNTFPGSRSEAEKLTLPVLCNWENELEPFWIAFDHLND